MAPETSALLSLSNPLVTASQLSNSSSRLDGVPADLESSIRFAGAQLTQAAGILLRLPQEIVAQAIVVFWRFYVGPEGGSVRTCAAKVCYGIFILVPPSLYVVMFSSKKHTTNQKGGQDISAASLYMTAKASAFPQSPRSVINVYAYILSRSPPVFPPLRATEEKPNFESYYVTEGDYYSARSILVRTESILLRSISFVTNVVLPHRLALTYLRTLGALPSTPSPESSALAGRALAHLNTALLSPQLLYLTHQPAALAVASIYLAARETGVRLSGCEWWEVFDVDREELGFLVVGLKSCEDWIAGEKKKWSEQNCPITVEDLEAALKKRDINGG